jgi:hypothetical protein
VKRQMLNTDFDMKEPRGWPGTALQVPMLDGEGGSTYMDCADAQGSNTLLRVIKASEENFRSMGRYRYVPVWNLELPVQLISYVCRALP